jgi:hydroxyacylglutathione hydrolase
LETHNHADHVSGHGRLAVATGATVHINRLAAPDYEHEAFDDGWELELGRVVVRALHTPGHRPEHTAFALIDTARGPEPGHGRPGVALPRTSPQADAALPR